MSQNRKKSNSERAALRDTRQPYEYETSTHTTTISPGLMAEIAETQGVLDRQNQDIDFLKQIIDMEEQLYRAEVAKWRQEAAAKQSKASQQALQLHRKGSATTEPNKLERAKTELEKKKSHRSRLQRRLKELLSGGKRADKHAESSKK